MINMTLEWQLARVNPHVKKCVSCNLTYTSQWKHLRRIYEWLWSAGFWFTPRYTIPMAIVGFQASLMTKPRHFFTRTLSSIPLEFSLFWHLLCSQTTVLHFKRCFYVSSSRSFTFDFHEWRRIYNQTIYMKKSRQLVFEKAMCVRAQ